MLKNLTKIMICFCLFQMFIVFPIKFYSQNIFGESLNNCQKVCQPKESDDFFNADDYQERFQKVKEISGILDELQARRDNFLKTGDLRDLFPALYFNTTKLELDSLLKNNSKDPVAKMDMMERFYDAYQMNRNAYDQFGINGVEKHWQPYYQSAEQGNKLIGRTDEKSQEDLIIMSGDLINQAVYAHVKYDLPRAINDTLQNSTESEKITLKKDFDNSNSIFEESTSRGIDDVSQALFPGSSVAKMAMKLGSKVPGLAPNVIKKREESWDRASRGEILTIKQQPRYPHKSVSTTYLPSQLQSAICLSMQRTSRFDVGTGFQSDFKVCFGDEITQKASGSISFGDWAGNADPNGFPYPAWTAYNYSDLKNYPHGCLIIAVTNSTETNILGYGSRWSKTVPFSGTLYFLTNDADNYNNKGYFNSEITQTGNRLILLK